jgi:GrpB-like predicted nucleotidyltransferase (UPF0157 family)
MSPAEDNEPLREQLALRDHLRAHPEDAARYEALKRELAEREAYTEAKTEFIRSILERLRR